MEVAKEKLISSLKQCGSSLTKTRLAIFLALVDQEPLTMSDLIRKVGTKTDRSSIYRTIALFERLGIVQRLQMGWKYKLELSDDFAAHHHHLTCISCGSIKPIKEDEQTEAHIMRLAQNHRFQILSHQLEIRGNCQNCTQNSLTTLVAISE